VSSLREEVVDPAALAWLEKPALRELLAGFYLGGGTAVALHLGHRLSRDLDFFSPQDFLPEAILARLPSEESPQILGSSRGTLHLLVGGIRLGFLHYPYALLEPLVSWRGTSIASLLDLGLMKLSAVAGRGTKRDFYDLYFICQEIPLPTLVSRLEDKFGPGINRYQVLKSLTFFADAEDDPEPVLLKKTEWNQVKEFFARETPKLLKL
jgi:hypothetical protein